MSRYLLIGKDNVSWGPGRRGNLLFSANPLPMDMIQIRAQYGKIGFNAFTGIAKSSFGDRKIISAHRVDLNLWDIGNFGIAESLVIGGDNFELGFLNPFSVYLAIEPTGQGLIDKTVATSTGNTLISSDLELRISQNAQVYGELVVDDFQTRQGLLENYRNWGTKFGIQLGFHLVDPLSINNTDLRIEYAFINQFAYTHKRLIRGGGNSWFYAHRILPKMACISSVWGRESVKFLTVSGPPPFVLCTRPDVSSW